MGKNLDYLIKKSPPAGWKSSGRRRRKALLLFLPGAGLGLGGLRFGHALLEFVHATGGIDEFLRASIEGMAGVANTNQKGRFGGAGLDDVAASATNFRVHIFRMYVNSHNKGCKSYQPQVAWQVLNPKFVERGAKEHRI
jgi:hypothetical protein